MSGLARFFKGGAADADRRVAAALAPPETAVADRVIKSSGVISAIDAAMLRLTVWAEASQTARLLTLARASTTDAPTGSYRPVASGLLVAVIAHLSLTLMQGPRPGWFWLIIPALVAAFSALLYAGSPSSRSAD